LVQRLGSTSGSHTATYRYVANSRLRAGVTYRANGTQRLDTQYDFDRLNRLQQVLNQPSAAGQPAERHAYTYNAAQQRIRDELADGSSWNWEYDRLGQVIGGRKSWSDGSPVAGQQFEYGFDDIGNRVSQKRGGDANGANLRSTTYVVNPLNQITNRTVVGSRYLDLIGLAEPGTTVTAGGVIASRRGEFWRAELNLGNGNPLWQSVNITTSDGGSLANALYRVPPSSEVPTYDPDGNLTADGLWTYTWDAENRLISMQSQALVPTAGRRKLDFEYDPLGRRIGRIVSTGASGNWVPTSTTRWLYEGWNPVAELNGAGTLVREYVWGTDLSGGWQGAGGVGGLLWVLEAPTGANAAHYTAYDGNGNVMGLVNAADGTWSARYEYGPFGEVVRATGTMAAANPFRWSTKIQDEDTGLNYYGYRYYSAAVGRWLGRDVIGERGGVNSYAFVRNGPTGWIDSDGRKIYLDGEEYLITLFYGWLEHAKAIANEELKRKLEEIEREEFFCRIKLTFESSAVFVGEFSHRGRPQAIDVGDILKFPESEGPQTRTALMVHELVEAWEMQKNGKPYETAHAEAVRFESMVTGFTRVTNSLFMNPLEDDISLMRRTTLFEQKISTKIDRDGKVSYEQKSVRWSQTLIMPNWGLLPVEKRYHIFRVESAILP
jgi:RHS repeat-associated protein